MHIKYLVQWFSARGDFAPSSFLWGHLGFFCLFWRDIYFCLETLLVITGGMLLASNGQRPGMFSDMLKCTGQPPTTELSGPECQCCQVWKALVDFDQCMTHDKQSVIFTAVIIIIITSLLLFHVFALLKYIHNHTSLI